MAGEIDDIHYMHNIVNESVPEISLCLSKQNQFTE